MKTKLNILIIVSLVLMLGLTSSCTRKTTETPGPTGPSTYSIIIEADASPNVIIAGETRDSTIITATVTNFQGIPLANETIVFEIIDPTSMQPAHNAGYFEGNKTVATRVTNSNGAVSVKYMGPLVDEMIESDTTPPDKYTVDDAPMEVYIRASLSWRGEQFVVDYAPIEIIIDFKDLELFLRASPNVLWIVGGPQKATLTATLRKVEGAPVQGRTIYFSFDNNGPGEFQNGMRTAFVTTNAKGEATVTYVSPDRNHISKDRIVVRIRAHLKTEDPNWAHAETEIQLNRGN
jgi:hypothetical protein